MTPPVKNRYVETEVEVKQEIEEVVKIEFIPYDILPKDVELPIRIAMESFAEAFDPQPSREKFFTSGHFKAKVKPSPKKE